MTTLDRLKAFASNTPHVGLVWHDKDGNFREIIKETMLRGVRVFLVGTSYKGRPAKEDKNPEVVKLSDIEGLIYTETRLYEANQKSRKQAEMLEEKKAQDHELAYGLDGFDSTFNKMQAARVVKTLSKSVLYKGRPITLRDLVRQYVARGAVPSTYKSKPVLKLNDGTISSPLPQFAVDYAQYLINKAGSVNQDPIEVEDSDFKHLFGK